MACKCITKWVDYLNGMCANSNGDEEEGGEACCKMLSSTLKEWVNPTDEKGFMQTLLCPVLDSEFYKNLKQCASLSKMAYAVGVLGFMVCMESFFAKPWWNQVKECVGEDCACPTNWKFMVMFMYVKALGLNIVGMIVSAGLVYGMYCEKPDYIPLWLMWRAVVICFGGVSFLLVFAFSHVSPHSLDSESYNELVRLVVNVASYLIVLAYSEQDAEGEAADGEGGTAGDEEADGDAFIAPEARDALSSAIY